MVALGPCSQACFWALGPACSQSISSRLSPGGDAHPPGQGDHSACHSGLRAGQASGRSPELHQAPVPAGEGWEVVKSECQNWVKTKTAPIRQAAGGGPDPVSPGSSPHRLQGRTAVPRQSARRRNEGSLPCFWFSDVTFLLLSHENVDREMESLHLSGLEEEAGLLLESHRSGPSEGSGLIHPCEPVCEQMKQPPGYL